MSLYRSTGNKDYLRQAEEAGEASMTTIVWTDSHGMITESKRATNNNDSVGFRCTSPLNY